VLRGCPLSPPLCLDPAAQQQRSCGSPWLGLRRRTALLHTTCSAADGNGEGNGKISARSPFNPPEANTKTKVDLAWWRSVPVWPNSSAQKICARFLGQCDMALFSADPSAGSSSNRAERLGLLRCWSRCCPGNCSPWIQAGLRGSRYLRQLSSRDCRGPIPPCRGGGVSRSCWSNESDPLVLEALIHGGDMPGLFSLPRALSRKSGLVKGGPSGGMESPSPRQPDFTLEALCREAATPSRGRPDQGFREHLGIGSDDLTCGFHRAGTASGRNYCGPIQARPNDPCLRRGMGLPQTLALLPAVKAELFGVERPCRHPFTAPYVDLSVRRDLPHLAECHVLGPESADAQIHQGRGDATLADVRAARFDCQREYAYGFRISM